VEASGKQSDAELTGVTCAPEGERTGPYVGRDWRRLAGAESSGGTFALLGKTG
jgi:hypothetical protein